MGKNSNPKNNSSSYSIESPYDLELKRVISKINSLQAKRVCIQLPDGLKPLATKIADALKQNTKAEIMIWAGSCFGACDIPNVDADLLVQWGHSSDLKTYKDL